MQFSRIIQGLLSTYIYGRKTGKSSVDDLEAA